ncbi:MAG: hypothetical protein JWM11_7030 [Planctomycetaceae bacterium]|nr:hypothetical protein [Planctomycetaceae bacterium]
MLKRRNELGEKAVQVLATSFVLLGGALASVFLIVTNSGTPLNTLLVFAGGCLVTGFILWLLRDPDPLSPRAKWFHLWRRPKSTTTHYQLRVRKTERSHTESAPKPPTAEQIRELARDGMNTWIPSNGKPIPQNREET